MSVSVGAVLSGAGQAVSKVVKVFGKKGDGGRGKTGIITAVVVGLFLFMIIPIAAISVPGIIVKNSFDSLSEKAKFGEKIEQTEIYKKCQNVYNDLKNDYNGQVSDIVESVKKNNPVGYETKKVQIAPGKYVTYEIPIPPKVHVSYNIDEFDINLLLAYINTMYFDRHSKKKGYTFNKSEARDFLNNISSLSTSYTGRDPIYLTARISVLKYEEVADKYFTDVYTSEGINKRELFIESYKGLCEYNSR